jgi:hypothetical protein
MITTAERLTKPPLGGISLFGALGALYGAGAMMIVRLAMRRAGHVDKTVPQAIEEWTLHKLNISASGDGTRHFAAEQVLHMLYGVAWGVAAAPVLFASRRRRPLWVGSAFGFGTWAIGALGLFPLLRIARPAWKSSAGENLTNFGTHVIFGLAVQLLAEEATRPAGRGAASDAERHIARVG